LATEKRNAGRYCCSYRRYGDFRRKGYKLEDATHSVSGEAEKVTIDKDNTTIVSGKGKKSDIMKEE